MFDVVIRGGTVVDGSGSAPFTADVGVRDGRVAAVERGGIPAGSGVEEIDATGKVITPGFVDVHTHFDGQATWDDLLEPTSGHGVTTVVMGNCGVGFAPVKPGSEEWLVQLMEGVEDIPGTSLHEGIAWGWESFPQYLDALDARRYSMDISAYVAHGPLRAYVMGERGARNEPATADDVAAMRRLVQEAREAGAIGFSTSRTMAHKARDGEPVPGTFAAMDELRGISAGLLAGGGGIFEVAPNGLESDADAFLAEVEWMSRLALGTPLAVTFAMLQNERNPDAWRDALDIAERTAAGGGRLNPQIAARPFGMLVGWASYHPFQKRPTFARLAESLSHAELLAELARPDVRAAILGEADEPLDPSRQFDGIGMLFQTSLDRIYSIGVPPDYEPTPDRTVTALAAEQGVEPLAHAYDLMNTNSGTELLMLPFFNFVGGNHDAIFDMLTHPTTISGLSDGGAHVRMICDASIPTYLLTHWARDRRGAKVSLQDAVKAQTSDTAALAGFTDRGVIEVGKRADLNVIDFERLALTTPHCLDDLPAGGRRLLQEATGYVATMVNGEITRRHGVDTGKRPGRLVRA